MSTQEAKHCSYFEVEVLALSLDVLLQGQFAVKV